MVPPSDYLATILAAGIIKSESQIPGCRDSCSDTLSSRLQGCYPRRCQKITVRSLQWLDHSDRGGGSGVRRDPAEFNPMVTEARTITFHRRAVRCGIVQEGGAVAGGAATGER